MDFHPLAEMLPLMEGDAFAELVADIKEHGLREPVMVFEGKVLDGRNRIRACDEIGIQPDLEYFKGDDPVALIMSMNVHRRHLTTSQRAFIAAKIATWKPGGDRQSRHCANLRNGISQQEAATLLNVSRRSLVSAAVVRDHGTDEEKAAVVSGDKKASDVAYNIKSREARKPSDGSAPLVPGARLVPPDGLSVEDWGRKGMALEAEGKRVSVVATVIGINHQSYRNLRDILELSDRDALPAKDAELVRQALSNLNSTRRLKASYEPIKPIGQRVWGAIRTATSEANRREIFEDAISILVQACETGSQMEILTPNKLLRQCTYQRARL